MKILISLLFFLLALIGQGQPVIRTGGTITGQSYIAPNATTDAVQISCYEPLTFRNCRFKGLVRIYGGAAVSFISCSFDSVKSVDATINPRAIDIYQPQTVLIDSCSFRQTAGVRIDHRNENTKSVIIRNSKFINTDSRNGYGQFVAGEQRAAILIDGAVGLTGGIYNNYFYNEAGGSCIEDNINLRNSGGRPGQYFTIRKNYIDGAYSYPLRYDGPPSVSGITVETAAIGSDTSLMAQWVLIDSNRIVRTANGGINLTSCHDVVSRGNTVISSGKYPDGTASLAFWGGLGLWDGAGLYQYMRNVSQKGNTVAYVRPGVNTGGTNRQDWVVTAGSPLNIAAGDNYSLPYTPTKATEDSQFVFWQRDIAGQVPEIQLSDSVIKLGVAVTGVFTPLDDAGAEAAVSSVSYKTSATAICSVSRDSTNMLQFKLSPAKIGAFVLTVTFTNAAGETLSKDFPLTVILGQPRATGGRIKIKQSLN